MKKILVLGLIIFCYINTFSQLQLSRAANENNYTFSYTDPPISSLKHALRDPGHFSTFIEFGDGYFSNSLRDLNITRPFYQGVNYDPLAIMYAIYTPRPPTISTKNTSISNPSTVPVTDTTQNIIDTMKHRHVAVIPSITNLIPGDLMAFAVPYKYQGDSKDNYLVFLYNEKDEKAPDARVFEDIPANKIKFNNDPAIPVLPRNPVEIDAIRGGPGLVRVQEDAASLLKDFADDINAYQNNIVFRLERPDRFEHNLFVSLRTISESGEFWTTSENITHIKVIFVSGDDKPESHEIELKASQDLNSHDPNNISATPNCLKPDQKRRLVKFNFLVNFLNDGAGPAKKILIKPILDSNRALHLRNISNIVVTLGKNKFTLTQKDIVPIDSLNKIKDGTFILNFGDTISYSAIPNIPDYLLRGLDNLYATLNKENEGSVTFTCDGNVSDTQAEVKCYAGIFFDKNPVYQTPVPFKIRVSNDCDRTRDNFFCKYWWLILILLLALLIVIFKLRRRRHH